jgi:hypothetical protein
MITGEFLVCDDLGPLGRLVAPGELLVMDPLPTRRDYDLITAERAWISEKYQEAEKKTEYFRRLLKTARMGGEERRNTVREWGFDVWAIEAAKYAVCDRWLLAVLGKLEAGQQMAMNVPKDFSYNGFGPIRDLTKRVVEATDEEIIAGARFRTQ